VQTDYVELMAAQTSGADLAMQAASGINPAFWMTRISA
jgi:hypothetical protein